MSVLIGCSPSTGSSLLRRILNRHSEIFCGSETSIFAKSELYTDWESAKTKLMKSSVFGLSNAGWHDFVGVSLEDDYGWTKAEFKKLLKSDHKSFPDFARAFYAPILTKVDKSLWVEKTPSNAFTLIPFLKEFPNSKVIHITRHPLDAIASLYKRGMSLYNATNVYLLNTAMALSTQSNKNSYLIKYEDLVHDTQNVMIGLCNFLGTSFHTQMLEPSSEEGGVTKMEGWKQEETAKVTKASVGRFQELGPDIQDELLCRIALTEHTLDLQHKTITALASALGYTLPSVNKDLDETLKKMEKERSEDIRKRHFSIAHFRKHNYPISF